MQSIEPVKLYESIEHERSLNKTDTLRSMGTLTKSVSKNALMETNRSKVMLQEIETRAGEMGEVKALDGSNGRQGQVSATKGEFDEENETWSSATHMMNLYGANINRKLRKA